MAAGNSRTVSRNDPCPCGSGKRYKACHGALGAPANDAEAATAPPSQARELLYAALGQQQAGALPAAEALYRRALALAPDHPDGLHMLGTICYRTGRSLEAFELIGRALDATGWKFAPMRYNMGLVVAQLIRERDGGSESGAVPDSRQWAAVQAASEKLTALMRTHTEHALSDGREPISVAEVTAPDVSIVIPAYGQHRFTHGCIRGIVRHTTPANYEIVVVDDASPEPVATALAHVSGIRVIRNEANLGFLGSCNRGAALARGRVLVLLNNDTLVTDGWLPALVGTLREPDVGLVGARLVFPDGSLQEAGGIVWRDGSASNYGRNDDAGKPEYNYVRDADYCSGACLAVRRDDFLALGGFDAHFAPAYYEDTDLAMRMRAAGKRVVYQPAATVVHFEGATSGRDEGAGVKRHQADNRRRFHDRWRDALASHRESGVRADLEKDRGRRARVLVIDAYLPVPDKDSGSVRIVAILRLLVRAGCKVTFVAQNLEFAEPYARELQQAGIEVLHFPYAWSVPQILAQRGADLDLIWVSRHPVAAACAAAVRRHAPNALFVFDTVDLHFLRQRREAEVTQDADAAARAESTRMKELDVVRGADVTVVVSDAEREVLVKELPDSRVLLVSNVHDAWRRVAGFAERRDVFFVGGYQHSPNVDAAIWLAREIWPHVRARLPDVTMYLIGSNMPQQVRALEGNGIVALGHVPDLDRYLDGCRLSVAPLRFGAGVKGKITTAQARGVPVVATTLAIEGMHLEDGRDVLVADDPAQFADAVVRLHGEETLWTSISDAAAANVARHFSPDAAARTLAQLLAMADARRSGASRGERTHAEAWARAG
jgi:GT2 family glycosyltransferase